jgi:hypothetical protein
MDALTNAKFLAASTARWGASQGWYYKAINATPGTGILGPAQATFSATSAILEMQNTAPSGAGGSNVFAFPDYVRMFVTVADASGAGSSFQYVVSIDNKLRFASGGTQIVLPGTYANNYGAVQAQRIGPANIVSNGPQLAIFAGAVVLNAESANVVRTGRGAFKQTAASPVASVNDEYVLTFGSSADQGAGSSKLGAVTTPTTYRQNVGVHGIAPQSSLAVHWFFSGATTGVTVEFDIGWWECPTT